MGIHWQVVFQKTRHGRMPVFRFDAHHELIATFLSADVQRTGVARFRQAMEAVRTGISPSAEINGNVCSVMIGRQRVLLLDALAPDGMGNACVVEVDVFGTLLDAWERALHEAEERAPREAGGQAPQEAEEQAPREAEEQAPREAGDA